jgi:hypothetical protein
MYTLWKQTLHLVKIGHQHYVVSLLIWSRLLNPNHTHSLTHTERISKQIRNEHIRRALTGPESLSSQSSKCGIQIDDSKSTSSLPDPSPTTFPEATVDQPGPVDTVEDLLSRKMGQAYISNERNGDTDSQSDTQDNSSENSSVSATQGFEGMDFLLPDIIGNNDDRNTRFDGEVASIRFAPLIDASIISSTARSLVPQYGLLGSHTEARDTKSKLLLNTNVPFSMFLCGVQGSGKSYTTSCILENSLVPSRHLGKLRSPLSALVFSYSRFSGDGLGFTISEAAFLASPDPKLPVGAHVKKVHVLVSPSNFARISKLYLRLSNVQVTPFKLKPQDLDIDTMLILMNVNESEEPTLYMAQVTQILREMSTAGRPFDYQEFKLRLKQKQFNPMQSSMLQLRLDLLESFLDMNASHVESHFQPGEITIMDMSCPFVDANTACILFRIGLNLYLQSKANGKMIVVDEAHKVRYLHKH